MKSIYTQDVDGDLFGSSDPEALKVEACDYNKPEGYVKNANDCDDGNQGQPWGS